MTTKANKFGLRKAAEERTNRHAQRTPLPPKAGVVEAAREPICTCGDPEMGTLIHSRNCPLSPKTEDRSTEIHPETKSATKAQAFTAKAESLGWSVAIGAVAGATEVTAQRGPETIVQAWAGGVWDYTVSFYAYGDRDTKPRNASGAGKLLARSADEAAAEFQKVQSNKHFRKAEPKDIEVKLEEAQRVLPFDPSLAPDEEICGILAGQAVVWYNRLSRGQESAIVGRKGAWISQLPDGARVANICCPVTGYRSFLVTSILKVGRGRNLTTKGSEHAAVEVA